MTRIAVWMLGLYALVAAVAYSGVAGAAEGYAKLLVVAGLAVLQPVVAQAALAPRRPRRSRNPA